MLVVVGGGKVCGHKADDVLLEVTNSIRDDVWEMG